jgi:hypothetical protein
MTLFTASTQASENISAEVNQQATDRRDSTYESDNTWALEKSDEGITISSREVNYSDFREFKAELTLKTSIDSIIAVFHDPTAFTRWVHQCSHAEIIQQNSFLDVYVYQVSDMPVLVTDRDVVIRDVYSYSNDYKEWTIDVQAVEGMVPDKGMVRVTESKGTYKMTDLGDGTVKIVWHQHADPGGSLPSWLVNSLIVDLPFNTLENLRELVKEDKYATAKIGYDDNGIPTHWTVKDF